MATESGYLFLSGALVWRDGFTQYLSNITNVIGCTTRSKDYEHNEQYLLIIYKAVNPNPSVKLRSLWVTLVLEVWV